MDTRVVQEKGARSTQGGAFTHHQTNLAQQNGGTTSKKAKL